MADAFCSSLVFGWSRKYLDGLSFWENQYLLSSLKKGAKRAVAIPFKKIGDAKKLFKKEIKKDPNIKPKDGLIGRMDLDKEKDGRTVIKIQQIAGGASPAIIHKQGNELFALMGFKIQLLSKAEGKAEKIKKVRTAALIWASYSIYQQKPCPLTFV